MIKIKIIAIGKHKDSWVESACAHYEKLLSREAKLEFIPIPSPAKSDSLTPAQIKQQEALVLNKHLKPSLKIALSDSGKQYDSIAFAAQFEKWLTRSNGTISFIIGGPYGLDDSILNEVDFRLSLSPLTFSHQLVRPVLLEQLYRAFSINSGRDYHK